MPSFAAGSGLSGFAQTIERPQSRTVRRAASEISCRSSDKQARPSYVRTYSTPRKDGVQRKTRQQTGKLSKKRQRGPGWDPLHFTDDAERSQFLREAEVLHARWAMLGVLGLIVPDLLGGPLVLLPDLGSARLVPFTIQLIVALGVLEAYRGAVRAEQASLEERVYPGRRFDVLGLTGERRREEQDEVRREGAPGLGVYAAWLGGLPGWLSGGWWWSKPELSVGELREMKARELNNGRLAMVAFTGVYAASMVTGKGPVTLLFEHVADPAHTTVLQALQL